jgi:HPt (histidine-containing phosphotransfer) domain-containing protein
MMLEAGMNDYLSKPILKTELMRILSKWIPSEKLIYPAHGAAVTDSAYTDAYKEFWESVEHIEGLSVTTGLDRVDGQRDNYRKTLRLMLQEITKSKANLPAFLMSDDMDNFRIEVHGIKGALASIGAMKLCEIAYVLEKASGKNDILFCTDNLPALLEGLDDLFTHLKKAFSIEMQSGEPIIIPPELPEILSKITAAFSDADLISISNEIENINSLDLCDSLKNEIEQIKDMVLMMDYDNAASHIRRLLNENQV